MIYTAEQMRDEARVFDEGINCEDIAAMLRQGATAIERVAELEKDCLTLAMRLYGESDDTFSPETYEVMKRWRPVMEAALAQGKST